VVEPRLRLLVLAVPILTKHYKPEPALIVTVPPVPLESAPAVKLTLPPVHLLSTCSACKVRAALVLVVTAPGE